MSHRGSILALPSGIRAWAVAAPAELTTDGVRAGVRRSGRDRSAADRHRGSTWRPCPSRCAGASRTPASASTSCRPARPPAPTTSCWREPQRRRRSDRRRLSVETGQGAAGGRRRRGRSCARPTATAISRRLFAPDAARGRRCWRSTPSTSRWPRPRGRVRAAARRDAPAMVARRSWQGEAGATCAANPVAAALARRRSRATACRARALLDLIEARTFDLYDDPMPTVGDLEGYCGGDVFGADAARAA